MNFNLKLASQFIIAAELLEKTEESSPERNSAILYQSLISIEISLKAALEKAGYQKNKLKKISHNLKKLLDEVSLKCEFIDSGIQSSGIRALNAAPGYSEGTVGRLLSNLESKSVSQYPGEIRYKGAEKHYPAEVMLECARLIYAWCNNNQNNLRKKER